MSALQFPCTVFKTQKWMDDHNADDMRCGDLSESQLRTHFNLDDVSTKVNPYTLTKITPFNQPQSMFYGMHGEGEKVTRQECVQILFNEFRHLSQVFAVYGPYKHLIGKMIDHMQNGKGTPFRDMSLDAALKEQILHDKTSDSSLSKIKIALTKFIDWDNGYYPENNKNEFETLIRGAFLPKFNKWQDNFNSMGITVHDIHATHLTIKSLQVKNDNYRAIVNYRVQDHFGLDNNDIMKWQFHHFRFFRIWFVLQRYNQFAYKPFMTDMEATVEIAGNKNDKV